MFNILSGGSTPLIVGIIVGILLLIVVSWWISTSNKFKRMQIKIDEALSGIDVALTKRFDLLTKAIATAKGYAKHEQETLEKIVAMRNPGRNSSLEEKQAYKDRFNETIEKVVMVFGIEKAFRDISTDNTKIYKTIADFIMPSLERMTKEYIEANKELIYTRLLNFLKIDEIQDSISKRTSDKDIVNLRLRMWFKEFEDAISL